MGSIGMDWNQKGPFWDWENMPILGSNPNENPKNVVQAEPKSAGAVADIGHESGHSPGSTFSSSSEIGCGSSKSSISASIGSSTILGDNMELNIASANEPGRSMCKNSELCKVDDTETSQLSVEAASHGEPLIGLKLGKRTYFEDACGGQSVKSSPMDASVATSSPSPTKKAKGDQNALKFYCQVEGCKIDLFSAKSYHQKHRVCEAHSKAPKVVVAGLERRFCQQCSRFHALTEFDQKKRSCRRRLNDHNFRRRKPKQEAVPFGPLRLSTIFFDARQQRTDTRQRATDARQRTTDVRQQISLLFGQAPYGEITSGASSVQDSPGPGGFEFTETKAPWLKPTRAGGVDEMHISSQQLPNNILRHGAHCSFDGLVAFKETNSKALDQGMEASAVASDSAGGPDFQRALSLLSINSEGDADVIIQPGSQMHSGFTAIAGASNHVMTSSAALWQGSLSLDQQQQQFQSFDRLGNGSATPHYLRLQLPKPSYGNSHYDQMQ